MLYFERVDKCSRLDFTSLPKEIDPSILFQDTNITVSVLPAFMHTSAQPDSILGIGTRLSSSMMS